MKTAESINANIAYEKANNRMDTGLISDTFHTFDELYAHRIALWIALCKEISYHNKMPPYQDMPPVFRSLKHSDNEPAYGGGWFVLGIYKGAGDQLTYHLPISEWDNCGFAETLDKAPEWDGHTSSNVLERLKQL